MKVNQGHFISLVKGMSDWRGLPENHREAFIKAFSQNSYNFSMKEFKGDSEALIALGFFQYDPCVMAHVPLYKGLGRWHPLEQLKQTMWLLNELRFIQTRADSAGKSRVYPSDSGEKWIRLNVHDRLQTVLESFANGYAFPNQRAPKSKAIIEWQNDRSLINDENNLGGHIDFGPSVSLRGVFGDLDFSDHLQKAFASCGDKCFWSVRDFALRESRSQSLIQSIDVGRKYWFDGGNVLATIEDVQNHFFRVIAAFLDWRIFPWGGVVFGTGEDGFPVFRLTPIGLYILGQGRDFQIGWSNAVTEIVVQPNFEIVFLAPDPSLEGEIGQFAKRLGKGVGTLFCVTRETVIKACGNGWNGEKMLKVLRRNSKRDLPANVIQEITNWSVGVRFLEVRTARLIEAPDRETFLKIISVAGKFIKPLSETTGEIICQSWVEKDLKKKLRLSGLFLSSESLDTKIPAPKKSTRHFP